MSLQYARTHAHTCTHAHTHAHTQHTYLKPKLYLVCREHVNVIINAKYSICFNRIIWVESASREEMCVAYTDMILMVNQRAKTQLLIILNSRTFRPKVRLSNTRYFDKHLWVETSCFEHYQQLCLCSSLCSQYQFNATMSVYNIIHRQPMYSCMRMWWHDRRVQQCMSHRLLSLLALGRIICSSWLIFGHASSEGGDSTMLFHTTITWWMKKRIIYMESQPETNTIPATYMHTMLCTLRKLGTRQMIRITSNKVASLLWVNTTAVNPSVLRAVMRWCARIPS